MGWMACRSERWCSRARHGRVGIAVEGSKSLRSIRLVC